MTLTASAAELGIPERTWPSELLYKGSVFYLRDANPEAARYEEARWLRLIGWSDTLMVLGDWDRWPIGRRDVRAANAV